MNESSNHPEAEAAIKEAFAKGILDQVGEKLLEASTICGEQDYGFSQAHRITVVSYSNNYRVEIFAQVFAEVVRPDRGDEVSE